MNSVFYLRCAVCGMADHETAGDVASALVAEAHADMQEVEEEDEELSMDMDSVSGTCQKRWLVWVRGLSLTLSVIYLCR